MNAEPRVIYSVGECPVCFSSGTLLILISIANGKALFYCPACETAWDAPPRGLDKVRSLQELAPGGARFASKSEVEQMSLDQIIPVPYEEWANHLKGIP